MFSFSSMHHALIGEIANLIDLAGRLAVMNLSGKKASMGTSLLVGLLVAAIVGVVLELTQLPLGTTVGAFVGGAFAAFLFRLHRSRGTVAGFMVGLLSFPIQLLLFSVIMTIGFYIPPDVPPISESEILIALAVTIIIQVIAGTIGGLFGGIVRDVSAPAAESPPPAIPPPPPRVEKYCVQCGAGLAKETHICHACGARQTQ